MSTNGDRNDVLFGTAYRTVERLGQVHAVAVLRAEHLQSRQPARIRVLGLNAPAAGGGAAWPSADRVRLEADALRAIAHPHVERLLDAGLTSDGRPFAAVEELPGACTLGLERTRRDIERFPLAEAGRIAMHVLCALEAVHARGLVHRDIGMDSVRLTRPPAGYAPPEGWALADGRIAMLGDFALVKVVEPAGGVRPNAQPTRAGVLFGRPVSFSPEQVAGAPLSPSTDVYQVGVLLFELLTGRPPFGGGTQEALESKVKRAAPRVSDLMFASQSQALDAVVATALARHPSRRYQTVRHFAEALWLVLEPERPLPMPAWTPGMTPEPPPTEGMAPTAPLPPEFLEQLAASSTHDGDPAASHEAPTTPLAPEVLDRLASSTGDRGPTGTERIADQLDVEEVKRRAGYRGPAADGSGKPGSRGTGDGGTGDGGRG